MGVAKKRVPAGSRAKGAAASGPPLGAGRRAASDERDARRSGSAESRTVAAPGAAPLSVPASAIDEEALGDLAHDARNAFHKLYYLAEVLSGEGAPNVAGEAPGEMLGRVVRELDQMFQDALAYARPVAVSPIAMTGAEVAGALESWLRAEAEGAEISVVASSAAARVALRIDPGHFPRAIALVLRELARGAGESGRLARASASLDVGGGSPATELEIRIDAAAASDERPARKARRLLPWAMARRVIEAHGGRISPCGDAGPARGCLVALPLRG